MPFLALNWLISSRNTYSVNRRTFSSHSQTSRMSRKIRKKIMRINMMAPMTSQRKGRRRWSRWSRRPTSTTSSRWPSTSCSPPRPCRHWKGGDACRDLTPARCSPRTPTTTSMSMVKLRPVSCPQRALVTNQEVFLNRSQAQQQVEENYRSFFLSLPQGFWSSIYQNISLSLTFRWI